MIVLASVDPKTKALLESAYSDYHSHHSRNHDPVSLVHGYARKEDQEVAAFLAALLAYGNVRTILNSVKKVLDVLGPHPYSALKEQDLWPKLHGFRHRFTTGEDLEVVCAWMGSAIRSHENLDNFFADSKHPSDASLKDLLSDFVQRFKKQTLPHSLRGRALERGRSLKYLLSDPLQGSACKRLNMFLRWMVRDADEVDLGLWKSLKKHQLMLPIDTHLLQTLQLLRWTRSKQATWRVVEEATKRLREYAPEDPVRYDFALCHLSMAGGSLKQYRERKSDGSPLER